MAKRDANVTRSRARVISIALAMLVTASCADVLGLDDLRFEQTPGQCVTRCDAGTGGTTGGAGGSATGASSGSGGRSAGGAGTGSAGTGSAGTGGAGSGSGGDAGDGAVDARDADASSGGDTSTGGTAPSGGAGNGGAGGTTSTGGTGKGGSRDAGIDADVDAEPSPPQAPACPGVFSTRPSFLAFKAGALHLTGPGIYDPGSGGARSGPGEGFIVEGDRFFRTESELRDYYDGAYVGGDDGAPRVPPFTRTFSHFDKRSIDYCVDNPAGSGMGGFGPNYYVVGDAANAAGAAWEQHLDLRFVHRFELDATCASGNPGVDIRILRAAGAPYTSVLSSLDGSTRVDISIGDPGAARSRHDAEAMLRHAFGHVLGLEHSRPARTPSPGGGELDGGGDDLNEAVRWSAMRTTWCGETPDGLFPNAVDLEPTRVGYLAPTRLVERGQEVYARRSNRDVSRRAAGSWTRVAGPTRAVLEVDGALFRLSEDGSTIETLDPPDGGPTVIGGPANHILRCGHHLCAISAADGSLLRHDAGTWERISGRARQFASTDSTLARIPLDGQGVELFDEGTKAWMPRPSDVTMLAGWMFAGPDVLYATNPRPGQDALPTGHVYALPPGGDVWVLDTGPGRYFVPLLDGSLAAMTPLGERINFRSAGSTLWQVGIALGWQWRIYGRNELYAEDGGGGYHVYRQSTWTALGVP